MASTQLFQVLGACLSPDPAARKAAEATLAQALHEPGALPMLLAVAAGEGGAPPEASHVAATVLKNAVRRGWEPEGGEGEEGGPPPPPPISAADKAAVRASLLPALAGSPRPVQAQLVETLRVVALADWPEAWPDLAPALAAVVEEGGAAIAAGGAGGAGGPALTRGSLPAARLHAALLATRVLARQYEFRDGDRRAPLLGLAVGLFPGLLRLGGALLAAAWPDLAVAAAAPPPPPSSAPAADAFAGELLKLILKCLWSALYMGVPPPWMEVPGDAAAARGSSGGSAASAGAPGSAGEEAPRLPPTPLDPATPAAAWLSLVHTVLVRPVPEPQPPALDDRPEWPWWKAKKWALHLATRLAGRYGDPKKTRPGSPDRAFAAAWAGSGVPGAFLDAVLALLARPSHGAYVTPRATNLALQYAAGAVPSPTGWRALKPHVPALLAAAALPAACFDDRDAELWTDDPAEFVRKGNDVMEELFSPKSAAVNFVHELCRVRPKAGLPPVMTLLSGVFAEADAAGVAGMPPALARRLDGALLLTGALAPLLKRRAPYKDQVPALVARVILPLFASPHGHLRAKAAWAGSTLADAPLGGGGGRADDPPSAALPGTGPTFDALFAATAAALADRDLPVRVDAATALRSLVDALDPSRVPAFAAGLPGLLRPLLALLGELDSEGVLAALEAVVDKVGPAIAPYAAELTGQLVAAYTRMAGLAGKGGEGGGSGGGVGAAASPAALSPSASLVGALPGEHAPPNADEEEDEDAAMAAYGVLRALLTILDAVSGLPGAVGGLAPALIPLLSAMLNPASPSEDTLEEALDLLAYLTFFTPAPLASPDLWALFPRLVACYHAWAADFLDPLIPALSNFMSRGTATFVGGGPAPAEVVAALAGTHLAPVVAQEAAAAGRPGAWRLPGGGPAATGTYPEAVLGIAEAALGDPDMGEEDAAAAPRLLTIMLHATAGAGLAPGVADAAVGLALARLPSASGSTLRSRLVCVVAAALHADAAGALASLAARGATAAFFAGWVAMAGERKAGRRGGGAGAPGTPAPPLPPLKHFKAAQDKRACVLGLAAALAAPPGSIPPELEAGGPALLGAALGLLEAWRAQADAAGQSGSEDGDSEFGWGGRGGSGGEEEEEEESVPTAGAAEDDDDASGGDDDAFLRRLARAAGRRSGAAGGGGSGDESWSDDDEDWSDEEDEVDTPATALDPGAVLLEAVARARAGAPGRLAGAEAARLGPRLEAAAAGVAAAAAAAAAREASKK